MNSFKFNSKIMGSSFKEGAQDVLSILEAGDTLYLQPEPTNKYDENAIEIYFGDIVLGYIAKETSPKILEDVKADKVKCKVAQVTGGVPGKDNFGCNIEVTVERDEEDGNK